MLLNKYNNMYKNKLFLIAMAIFCLILAIGSVSASEYSNSSDNLSYADDSQSIEELNAVDEVDSEKVGKSVDSDNEDNLSASDGNELLSQESNSSKEILSSSVSVSNGHTYHKGGYTFTVSGSQYKKITALKKGDTSQDFYFHIKTGKYKVLKVPKYKTVKATKYKWKYKTILIIEEYYNNYGSLKKYKEYYTAYKYYKNGWTDCKRKVVTKGNVVKYYTTFKKKVKYVGTKKVKNGYKKVKAPIYARIGISSFLPYVDFAAYKGSAYKVLNDYRRYWL